MINEFSPLGGTLLGLARPTTATNWLTDKKKDGNLQLGLLGTVNDLILLEFNNKSSEIAFG